MYPLKEALADQVHRTWADWMSYVFENSMPVSDGSVVIPKGLVERWMRQMVTPYSELAEVEKFSDRAIADDFLKIFNAEA